jgi:hypothetical protein
VVGSVMPLRDQNAHGEVLAPAAQDTGSRTTRIRSNVRVSYTPNLTKWSPSGLTFLEGPITRL